MFATFASLIPAARPALPSKMNGPASFLGVIGPSTPVTASTDDGCNPFGLGVRVDPRSGCAVGSPRREVPFGTGFRLIMSTGCTVAFETWGWELDELGGEGGSSTFIYSIEVAIPWTS